MKLDLQNYHPQNLLDKRLKAHATIPGWLELSKLILTHSLRRINSVKLKLVIGTTCGISILEHKTNKSNLAVIEILQAFSLCKDQTSTRVPSKNNKFDWKAFCFSKKQEQLNDFVCICFYHLYVLFVGFHRHFWYFIGVVSLT